ncbi:unnamed protein product [Lymnaea stagnalis]|uniref:Berberine/berberine-like domain-containing protein n=1 Tax=Lymnaea stagnalis TaxID=6523 RepID=A0AAV2HW32_LYMST
MATLIGGNMISSPVGSTPVHPGLRSGIMANSCGKEWPLASGAADEAGIDAALKGAHKLYTFGYGSYINEPAEDMPDWKTRFWADDATYARLLSIKKKVDPDNYFWCHNCVGSDLGQGYGSPFSQGIPGNPSATFAFRSDVEFDEIKTVSVTPGTDVIIG